MDSKKHASKDRDSNARLPNGSEQFSASNYDQYPKPVFPHSGAGSHIRVMSCKQRL